MNHRDKVARGRVIKDAVLVRIEEIKEEVKVGAIAISGSERTAQIPNVGTVVSVGPEVKGVGPGERVKWVTLSAPEVTLFLQDEDRYAVVAEDEIVFVYPTDALPRQEAQ